MLVYLYDMATGEFLKKDSLNASDKDPMNPDKYLIPAGATTVKMNLKPKLNEVAVFDEGVWKIAADFRGCHYWDAGGKEYEISEIGAVIPKNCFKSKPEVKVKGSESEPLTDGDQLTLVKEECERRIYSQWDVVGQLKVLRGLYDEATTTKCYKWIDSNTEAYHALMERDDFLSIDVTSDEYWPDYSTLDEWDVATIEQKK